MPMKEIPKYRPMTEPLIIFGNEDASNAGISTIKMAMGAKTKAIFDPFIRALRFIIDEPCKECAYLFMKKPRRSEA